MRDSARLLLFNALGVTAMFAVTTAVGAQQPQRIPGMVVRAQATVGRDLLIGSVHDTSGNPIVDADVVLGGLKLRARTNNEGNFRLEGVGRGTYTVGVRKLGFAPQVQAVRVSAEGTNAEFTLLQWPFSMPAVVTVTSRLGIGGTIVDTSYTGVPLVHVSVLGSGTSIETDSSGNFFLPAKAGSYMISMEKASYATRMASVTVSEDAGRDVKAFLYPAVAIPNEEAWNTRDFVTRHVNRNTIKDPFYTREDIQQLGFEWIHDLVVIAGSNQFNQSCHAVVNGGPATTPLSTLTVDDVESVELYDTQKFRSTARPGGTTSFVPTEPPADNMRKGKAVTGAGLPAARSSSTRRADIYNASDGLKCPTVYVWLR